MAVVASFLVAGIVLLLASPSLIAGRWQVHHPRTALTLWFSALFVGVGLTAAAVMMALVLLCAGAASGSMEASTLSLVGWGTLIAVAALLAFVSAVAEPLAESWRQAVGRFAPAAIVREESDGFTLVWFASDDPIACAVPAEDPEIYVSTALDGLLNRPQLRALIEHERAHLTQRHGWAVRIAEINALCLPRGLPAGRALKRATLLLVELIADDAAARRAGAVHLANALGIVGVATGDASLDLRARRLALRRWKSPGGCAPARV